MIRMLAIAALLTAAAGPAFAQSFGPAPSDAEARAPRPSRAPGIPTALATEAAQVAVAACSASGFKTTALVVDSEGTPIALISADGAAAITQRIASGKARTVIKLKTSSGDAVAKAKADPALQAALIADPSIGPPRPGAFPIIADGAVLAALAVSGSPTGTQDEPCAQAGVGVISGWLAARAATGSSATLDATHATFALPKDFKWEGVPGELRAKLYGDPDKPGPYGILYKWEPGHNSKPHSHAEDRFGYVISGTWWMSTSAAEDKSTLVPVQAGSFATHKANHVHWDGGVDTTALVLVTGIGPIKTVRVGGN